jgi:glycerol uptake facilitator-like aquaporin
MNALAAGECVRPRLEMKPYFRLSQGSSIGSNWIAQLLGAIVGAVGINITGTSVNTARSIGPALVGKGSNPGAAAQLWLFVIAPLIGAWLAGFLYREGALLDAPTEG